MDSEYRLNSATTPSSTRKAGGAGAVAVRDAPTHPAVVADVKIDEGVSIAHIEVADMSSNMNASAIRHQRFVEEAKHAVALEEALRKKLLGEAARQRETDEYLHHDPLAPGTPMPRSPPSEEVVEPGDDDDEEIVDAVSGESNVEQASAEPETSSAYPGATTTSESLPTGAETVHMPTSIIPTSSRPAIRRSPQRTARESLKQEQQHHNDEASTADEEFVEGLLHRAKNLKGAISRSLLPAACDLTPAQLKSYLAHLDVPNILGNAQPGKPPPPAAAASPQDEQGGERQAQAQPPPMRPRRYHIEKRKRIPELRERIEHLTEERDAILRAKDAAVDARLEQLGKEGGEQSSSDRNMRSDLLQVPGFQHEGYEPSISSSAPTGSKQEADARLTPPSTSNANHSEVDGEDPEEEDRLAQEFQSLNEEIHRLTSTHDRLEKVKDPAMPLSLQLGKNRSVGRGKPDDELWTELTAVAPGVRRFNCYGNAYDLERHILSPAMSECSEVPTLSPMSSIDGLSMASSRSAKSARSGRSASSGKLRRGSRSILQALDEAPSEHEQAAEASSDLAISNSKLTRAALEENSVHTSDMEKWKKDVERYTMTSSTSSVGSPPIQPISPGRPRTFSSTTKRVPPAGNAQSTEEDPASRRTSLSSNSTLASSTLSFPLPPVHTNANSGQTHKRPPAAMKTRRDLMFGNSREADGWSGRLSVSQELELAGSQSSSSGNGGNAGGGLRRIAEAILPEATMVLNAVPANRKETDMVVVPSEGDDFVESACRKGEKEDESIVQLALRAEGEAASTTPDHSPPPLPKSPILRDTDVPDTAVQSSPTPAIEPSSVSEGTTLPMVRGNSSPGKKRNQTPKISSSRSSRTIPQYPLTEKQAIRKAKEEARQAVWATRHANSKARAAFASEKEAICSRMFQTRDENIKARAHWELAEHYIRYSDTLGVPAGIQGAKMMQECLQRYEDLKGEGAKWARYAQMHIWLRRNGNGTNGGEQHLNLACNAFDQAARLAGEKTEYAGHCYASAAKALQEGTRSPRNMHEAQSYWRKAVQAACPTGLDERYASLANCCDILVSAIMAGQYEGEASVWRAACLEAIKRACTISPENIDWKARLNYYNACADDEGQLAAEEAEQHAQEEQEANNKADDGHAGGESGLRPEGAIEDEVLNSAYSHVEEDSDAFAIRQAMLRRVEGVEEDGSDSEEEDESLQPTRAAQTGDWNGQDCEPTSTPQETPSAIMLHPNTSISGDPSSPVVRLEESESPERPMVNPISNRDGQFLDMDQTTEGTSRSHPDVIRRDFGVQQDGSQTNTLIDSPIFGSDMADEEAGEDEDVGDEENGLPLAEVAMIVRPTTTQSAPEYLPAAREDSQARMVSNQSHSSAPPSIDPGFLLETLKEHHRAISQTNEALAALTQSIHDMNRSHGSEMRELRSDIRRDREEDRQETREMLEEHRNEQRTINATLEERMAGLQAQMRTMQDRQDAMERLTPVSASTGGENLAVRNSNRQATLDRLERGAPAGPSSPRTILQNQQLRFASDSAARRDSVAAEVPRPRSVPPFYNPNRHSVISNDPPPSFHSRADPTLGNSFGLTGMQGLPPTVPSTNVLSNDFTEADNDALIERGALLFGMYALKRVAQGSQAR